MHTAWTFTLELPLKLCRDSEGAFVQRVSTLKVAERASFADAFALALSARLQVLVMMTEYH